MTPYAAVVLSGGSARRLGGRSKPALVLGGRTLLERVLDAVSDATPRVVVGPQARPGLLVTREDPPGGGPVAALAAGLRLVPDGTGQVAILAADLPFVTAAVITTLREAATGADGALLVDADGAGPASARGLADSAAAGRDGRRRGTGRRPAAPHTGRVGRGPRAVGGSPGRPAALVGLRRRRGPSAGRGVGGA